VLDLLETYARERDIHVVLERVSAKSAWICTLSSETAVRSIGKSAREAMMGALKKEGVSVPSRETVRPEWLDWPSGSTLPISWPTPSPRRIRC
jgi:hypothetical protein